MDPADDNMLRQARTLLDSRAESRDPKVREAAKRCISIVDQMLEPGVSEFVTLAHPAEIRMLVAAADKKEAEEVIEGIFGVGEWIPATTQDQISFSIRLKMSAR